MGLYDRDYGRDEYGRDEYGSSWQPVQAKPKSAVIILIVINVALFLIDWLGSGQKANGGLAETLGATTDTILKPWLWWQFLTYGFVHGGLNHIAFNMLGLFIFGRPVEQRLGFAEFMKFYVVAVIASGILGSLFYVLKGEPALLIGASGAVVATTILFACFYPHVELLFMFIIPVKAWVLCAIFVGVDMLGALGLLGSFETMSRTAFSVHLAGAGFAAAYFYRRWSFEWLSADWLSNWRRNLAQRSRRMKLKIHDPDRKLQQEADEADRILAKIHASGEASLTRSERKVLESYSRRQRKKRDG
jgi:membrane associated rhomboid family serine protease